MAEAVRRDGCGSTGSRLLRGDREAFSHVERRFAAFKRAGRALYFSSGYLANIGVLATFPEPGDLVISDERNHASLIDGIRLSRAERAILRHGDVAHAAECLAAPRGDGRQAFVVVESLFSMDGDMAPLRELADLCWRAEAALIVDEAHAVGIYGERGSGLIEAAGVDDAVFLSINTAGKALGVSGAFVAGPSWAVDYLAQRARPFVFSTAPPPAVAAALDASLDVIEREPERRQRLLRLARHARERLREAGIDVPEGLSQIVPILVGDDSLAVQAADRLQAAGFDIRAIRPPTVPPGTARLRLSINAQMTEAAIDGFVEALGAVWHEVVTCCAASS